MPGIRVRDMFTTFKSLSGRDRIQYAWDYFRYPALVIIILLLFFGTALVQYITYREPLLQVITVNPERSVQTEESWFDEFFSDYGYEDFAGSVHISGYVFEDEENYTYDDNFTAMAVLLNAQQDLFIGTGAAYENVAKQGALADLSEILPQELLAAFQGQILYSDAGGTEESYPCAIFLKDNAWLESTGCYSEGCYFAICRQSANPQAAAEFAAFLLTQERNG